MRLWVVGERSGDPATWSIWSEYSIVTAESASAALALAPGAGAAPVAEIDMSRPMLLLTQAEPALGKDM